MILQNTLLLPLMLALAVTTIAQLISPTIRGDTTSSIPNGQTLVPVSNQIGIASSTQDLGIDIARTEWYLGKRGNVLLSPISIGSLLSLLLLGTDGETHNELKRFLHYHDSYPSVGIYENYQKILRNSIGVHVYGVNISMETRLFLQKEANVLNSFLEDALRFFNSKAENLDFVRDPARSTDYINKWVEQKTFGKITNIFSSPLPRETTFVAVNTIYFNGGWEHPFAKELTSEGTFFTGSKSIVIPMMSKLLTCHYLSDEKLGLNIMAIPYKGKNHAMYILMPKGDPNVETLQRIESVLTHDTLNELLQKMEPREMFVVIPRMKIAHKMKLEENLQLLGVNKIFNNQEADFSKLTLIPGIFVDSILHEAILEVTETGTIAAAATATPFRRASAPPFIFDRPSLVFIRDNVNDLTLFWARVVEPEPINLLN